MENLIKQQENVVDQMEKFKINLNKKAVALRTKNYYSGRITGWSELWQQFRNYHDKIMGLKSDKDKGNTYFENEVFENVEENYYDFKAQLQDLYDECVAANEKKLPENEKTVKTVKAGIKLPPADLPKFAGDYARWISFKDRFSAIINNAGEVSDVQKLDFLMTHLEGDALKLIENTPIEDNTFDFAWKALNKRYENKKLLVNAQLKILFNQPVIQSETAQNLRKMLDTTNQCINNLKHLKMDTSNWDPFLIFFLLSNGFLRTHLFYGNNNKARLLICQYFHRYVHSSKIDSRY